MISGSRNRFAKGVRLHRVFNVLFEKFTVKRLFGATFLVAVIVDDLSFAETHELLQAQFSVKAYGAKGDASTNDYVAISNAINAAGSVCGTVFFPQGHYIINSQLMLPSCVTLVGVGHPYQYTFSGQVGSILDFVNLPASTDGIVTSDHQAAQAVKIAHLQIERASGSCFRGAITYSNIQDAVFAYCGEDGLKIVGNSTEQSFMDTIQDVLAYDNGGDGVHFAISIFNAETTVVLITDYLFHNIGSGLTCDNCILTTVIGGAADKNGSFGYEILNSHQMNFVGTDAESNAKDGWYWSGSIGSMIGVRGSGNNTGATPFRTNLALIDFGSQVNVEYAADTASTSSSSINVLNSSSAYLRGGSFVSALNQTNSTLVKLDSLGPSCLGALSDTAVVIGGYVQRC